MIHSSYYRPRVYPWDPRIDPTQIDRVQELTASTTLNRTKVEEVGRDGIVCWKKSIPSVSVTLRQLEYGDMEFFRKLANVSDATNKIEMTDFKTPQADIAGYKTDDAGTFLGTVWYPKLRTSGFSLAIGDPDANIERSFTLVGEDEITFQNNNKYLVYLNDDTCSGAAHTIVIGSGSYAGYPTPIEDPDNSGKYMMRVVRERSGTVTEMVDGTDFNYSPTTITFVGAASASGDEFTAMYTATTYPSGLTPFTDNDTDLCGITADSCSIYLSTSDYLYRLQSVGVDVTWDRQDVREIGNKDIVARGARDITTRITLGRILENYTMEEVLRGVGSASYGKIDVRKFEDTAILFIKCFSDNTKDTMMLGYEFKDLTPVGIDAGAPLNDYVTRGVTLEGEEGFVSDLETDFTD